MEVQMSALLQQSERPAAATTGRGRLDYVDALRVLLIVLVVAHHALEAYVTQHPPEIPLPDAPIPRLWVFLWVNATFFMGLFFFLAGYFTPEAFDRKGAGGFLGDRWRRLGWPLVFAAFALVPFIMWFHDALDPAMPHSGFWTFLVRDFFGIGTRPDNWPPGERWPQFNFGHLWFVEHLLIYALLYAAVRSFIPADTGTVLRAPPGHLAILAYALLLAAATWLIRIWYPQDRWIGFLGFMQMEPAHWPQYASLFVLGLIAGPRRWIETMPARRGLTWFGIGAALAIAAYVLVGTGVLPGLDSTDWRVCLWEALLCTGLCVGLPVLFRELALGAGRLWHVLAANVFAVYVFHFPIVMALQWALIDAPAPKWLRLVATIVGAVVASFAFTNWIVLRLPHARRIF
jgi:peptidoglycan/LPS O-acetylase OafA/YrhL